MADLFIVIVFLLIFFNVPLRRLFGGSDCQSRADTEFLARLNHKGQDDDSCQSEHFSCFSKTSTGYDPGNPTPGYFDLRNPSRRY